MPCPRAGGRCGRSTPGLPVPGSSVSGWSLPRPRAWHRAWMGKTVYTHPRLSVQPDRWESLARSSSRAYTSTAPGESPHRSRAVGSTRNRHSRVSRVKGRRSPAPGGKSWGMGMAKPPLTPGGTGAKVARRRTRWGQKSCTKLRKKEGPCLVGALACRSGPTYPSGGWGFSETSGRSAPLPARPRAGARLSLEESRRKEHQGGERFSPPWTHLSLVFARWEVVFFYSAWPAAHNPTPVTARPPAGRAGAGGFADGKGYSHPQSLPLGGKVGRRSRVG